MNTIPMGTAYAIWSGIGTGGGTLVGMLLYNEAKMPNVYFYRFDSSINCRPKVN